MNSYFGSVVTCNILCYLHPRATPQRVAVSLEPNGTLRNGQFGCIEVSDDSGPPSTIWAKPLHGGGYALLAINGADLTQTIKLDFGALLAAGGDGATRPRCPSLPPSPRGAPR